MLIVILEALIVYFHLFGVANFLRIQEVPIGLVQLHQDVSHQHLVCDVYHCVLDKVEVVDHVAHLEGQFAIFLLEGCLCKLCIKEEVIKTLDFVIESEIHFRSP